MKTTLRLASLALIVQSFGTLLIHAASYPATVTGNNVLVRGQATIASESLGKLKKGEPVTVLDTIALSKPKQDEPTNWCKIQLPASIPVWVHSMFVDTNALTVKTKTLNLRGGPGENFSKLGTLTKGTAIKIVSAKDSWLRIETPETACGYVAATYVARKEDTAPTTPQPPTPEPQPPVAAITTVKETNTPAVTPVAAVPATNTMPLVVENVPTQPQVVAAMDTPTASATTPPATTVAPTPVVPEPAVVPKPITDAPAASATNQTTIIVIPPPERRVVTREGIVDESYHVNYPSWFVLKTLDNKELINYLYTSDTNIALKKLVGKRVLVKGEEGMDKRWKNTPVLTIDTIETIP